MQVVLLCEAKGILVVSKPAGMCVQGRGPTVNTPDLWEVLEPHVAGARPVHRIDRYTTGLVLCSAKASVRSYMTANWHGATRKTYLAIIAEPSWEETTVNTELDGKSAVTHFTVLEHAAGYALVSCQLIQNGRTHQIRRHLKSVGHPIVGDHLYGGAATTARAGQLLHAWRVEVRLPDESGNPSEWLAIQAPIPDDFHSYGFDWDLYDASSNLELKTWQVEQLPAADIIPSAATRAASKTKVRTTNIPSELLHEVHALLAAAQKNEKNVWGLIDKLLAKLPRSWRKKIGGIACDNDTPLDRRLQLIREVLRAEVAAA